MKNGLGRAKKEVMKMAEAMKGSNILEKAFYLATISRDMSSSELATFLSRSGPFGIVEDITREKGQEFAEAVNGN
jgi:hypothetical protein